MNRDGSLMSYQQYPASQSVDLDCMGIEEDGDWEVLNCTQRVSSIFICNYHDDEYEQSQHNMDSLVSEQGNSYRITCGELSICAQQSYHVVEEDRVVLICSDVFACAGLNLLLTNVSYVNIRCQSSYVWCFLFGMHIH